MTVRRREDRLGQIVPLRQAPEVHQLGRIRRSLPAQVHPEKGSDRLAVVQRVIGAFVRQSEALLHDVHTQHVLQPDRGWAMFALRVERLDQSDQQRPGRRRFDVVQKALPGASASPWPRTPLRKSGSAPCTCLQIACPPSSHAHLAQALHWTLRGEIKSALP